VGRVHPPERNPVLEGSTQLVGRILRVHRRLQGRARAKSLPPLLRRGYVCLAHAPAHEGPGLAWKRIS